MPIDPNGHPVHPLDEEGATFAAEAAERSAREDGQAFFIWLHPPQPSTRAERGESEAVEAVRRRALRHALRYRKAAQDEHALSVFNVKAWRAEVERNAQARARIGVLTNEQERLRAALRGYGDSDLVGLARATMARLDALEAGAECEALRDARDELAGRTVALDALAAENARLRQAIARARWNKERGSFGEMCRMLDATGVPAEAE